MIWFPNWTYMPHDMNHVDLIWFDGIEWSEFWILIMSMTLSRKEENEWTLMKSHEYTSSCRTDVGAEICLPHLIMSKIWVFIYIYLTSHIEIDAWNLYHTCIILYYCSVYIIFYIFATRWTARQNFSTRQWFGMARWMAAMYYVNL